MALDSDWVDDLVTYITTGSGFTPPTNFYVSAHTGTTVTGGNEVSGGSYARVEVTWGAVSSGLVVSAASVSIDVPSGQTAYALGLWTASTSGTLIATYTLDSFLAGPAPIVVAAGDFSFGISA